MHSLPGGSPAWGVKAMTPGHLHFFQLMQKRTSRLLLTVLNTVPENLAHRIETHTYLYLYVRSCEHHDWLLTTTSHIFLSLTLIFLAHPSR